MGILKTLIISHRRAANGDYVILLQKSPSRNQPSLIFQAGTVISVEPNELDTAGADHGFVKILEGYACLGMLKCSTDDASNSKQSVMFLIIVTGCVSVGKINQTEIFCISDVFLLSMRNETGDQELVQGLRRLLCSGCFYFSHSQTTTTTYSGQLGQFDLTLSAQRAHLTDQTDSRFHWNRLLFKHFEQYQINTSAWLVKVLCGGVNISTVYIGGLQAKACLISRLSCERAGTRFNVRGVNDLGHVANFVETEQVIYMNNLVLSYILIRGSIPLYWEQPGVQVGSHRIRISRGSELSQPAYDKHMIQLGERYQEAVLINLLSGQQRESEVALNRLFQLHHEASLVGHKYAFVNFDYHACCTPRGPQQKEILDKFYQQELDKHSERFGFFHSNMTTTTTTTTTTGSNKERQILQMQQGVLRVNCLDCLDRTNSIQTLIGLKVLQKMIKSIEQLSSTVDLDKTMLRLNDAYESLWVQNGDQISRIYTGTGALEGKNLLKDGTLSVARTIQNNLLDGNKQESIDMLILGPSLGRDFFHKASSLLPHYFMHTRQDLIDIMTRRYLDYCKQDRLKIAVATWNVNGGRHFDNIMFNRARPISDWLVDYRANAMGTNDSDSASEKCIDIYAIGFQEIVDLNAQNIVASSNQNRRDWLSEIQKTISAQNEQFLLVSSVQLVGICLFVFVRKSLASCVRDVCSSMVKTGLGGATGNKGAVAVRLQFKSSSLCFICGHFAAGQNHVKERNNDYHEVSKNLQFSMNRTIESHDYVFWCGDFNYRLENIANEDARKLASERYFDALVKHDQLKLSQEAKLAFDGYSEAKIKFAPTYKYDMNSNDYDTSEKCRIPAYTDRVLFKKLRKTNPNETNDLNNLEQIEFYNRLELLSSDHRPVLAEFDIEINELDMDMRSKIIDETLNEIGIHDATILVSVHDQADSATANANVEINSTKLDNIIKMFGDFTGSQVLSGRLVKNNNNTNIQIIFDTGSAAIKALELNDRPLEAASHDGNNYKLQVQLKAGTAESWRELVREELDKNKDSTINFISGSGPSVQLDDDEDATVQQMNKILGPEVNPDTICNIVTPHETPPPGPPPSVPPPPPPIPQRLTNNR